MKVQSHVQHRCLGFIRKRPTVKHVESTEQKLKCGSSHVRKRRERQTDGQTLRQTDRQTDRDRHTQRQRQRDRERTHKGNVHFISVQDSKIGKAHTYALHPISQKFSPTSCSKQFQCSSGPVFKEDLYCFLVPRLSPPGDRWCDVLGSLCQHEVCQAPQHLNALWRGVSAHVDKRSKQYNVCSNHNSNCTVSK